MMIWCASCLQPNMLIYAAFQDFVLTSFPCLALKSWVCFWMTWQQVHSWNFGDFGDFCDFYGLGLVFLLRDLDVLLHLLIQTRYHKAYTLHTSRPSPASRQWQRHTSPENVRVAAENWQPHQVCKDAIHAFRCNACHCARWVFWNHKHLAARESPPSYVFCLWGTRLGKFCSENFMLDFHAKITCNQGSVINKALSSSCASAAYSPPPPPPPQQEQDKETARPTQVTLAWKAPWTSPRSP